ncbi:MAG TPA: 6-phospho-3-hexuloisomerase, partial [Candidatus Pseudogracilibacillus intestinigallinarum]|nr:6-phospho-3-hexuloisomerase [Candidatus Pseudogracilibacillus intestinigallinarum]
CMHSGKKVYVIGETISPAIRENDVCILISGSAKTNAIRHIRKLAENIGATTFLVTANKEALTGDSLLSGLWINAATKHTLQSDMKTIQPLGNQFDQMAHIILDAAIIDSTNDITTMIENHTNME